MHIDITFEIPFQANNIMISIKSLARIIKKKQICIPHIASKLKTIFCTRKNDM